MLSRVDDGALAALPELQRDALEVALLRRPSPSPRATTRLVASGFLTVVRRLAAGRPVLLAVDDWQWLDPPSRRILEHAARRLEEEHVGLVYTIRPPATGLPTGGVADERTTRLIIDPMPLAALGRMLGDRIGRPIARPQLVRIAEASGGNPFYALEIARLAEESGSHPSGGPFVPVPADLRKLTAARIRRLPPATRDAVLLAAVVSGPDRRIVDLDALGPAEEAGIVSIDEIGRIEFTHPLFAAAAYGSARAARRRELHRRAAALVAGAEEQARQLALASSGPDSDVASRLDEGAVTAAARGASDAAAELSELAAHLTPVDHAEARDARLLTAAWHQFDAGDLERAGDLAQTLLSGASTIALHAPALHLASNLAARRSNFGQAIELATRAVGLTRDDLELRATIELHLVWCAVSAGDFGSADSHARAAVADAEALGSNGLIADALAVLTMVEFLCGRGVDRARLDRALALEDSVMTRLFIMRPRLIEGMLQLWTGELDAARDALERAQADAAEQGLEGAVPMLSFYLVWTYVWRGELDLASGHAAHALEQAVLVGDPTATAIALSGCALAHAHAGDTSLARREAGEAAALFQQLGWRSAVMWPLWALGLAELSESNPAAVHSALGPVAEQVSRMGAGDPVLLMFLPDEIEALVALGELDQAEALLAPFERLAADHERLWATAVAARCRGMIESARGSKTAGLAAFDRALAAHAGAGMPFERARSLFAAGQALRRFKQRGRAAELLTAALAEFEAAGAPKWAARAQAELARTGRHSADASGLTETERRLAELAAAGLSNREIAARASVSVKTVEANLTRTYRKLGVRSRVGLAGALSATAEQPRRVET